MTDPPPHEPRKPSTTEEFTVAGDKIVDEVKRIIREGNARKIVLRSEEGKTLMEIPLTAGLVGVALLPVFAAVGGIAALVARCTIVVVKRE